MLQVTQEELQLTRSCICYSHKSKVTSHKITRFAKRVSLSIQAGKAHRPSVLALALRLPISRNQQKRTHKKSTHNCDFVRGQRHIAHSHKTNTLRSKMGTYLSTPVLDKHTEKGDDLASSTPCRWSVVDMQGWRKSMEDAHVARTDVPLPSSCCSEGGENDNDLSAVSSKAQVFAVFDGHGGAEVARFCQMNLVPVLTAQDAWKNMSIAGNSSADYVEAARQEFDQNNSEAKSVGQALIDAFHALDRLIDDPSYRGEIDRWRKEKPPPYVSGEQQQEEEAEELTTDNGDVKLQPGDDGEDVQQRRHTAMDPSELSGSIVKLQEILANDEDEETSNEPCDSDSDNLENKEADGIVNDDSDEEDEKVEVNNANENDDGEIVDTTDGEGEEEGTVTLSSADAVTLFQKLLHMNVTDDDDDDSDEDDEEGESDSAMSSALAGGEEDSEEVIIPTKEQLLNPPIGIVAPSASVPTKIQNGRKVRLCFVCLQLLFTVMEPTLIFSNAPSSSIYIYHFFRSATFLTTQYTQDAHQLWLLLWGVHLL